MVVSRKIVLLVVLTAILIGTQLRRLYFEDKKYIRGGSHVVASAPAPVLTPPGILPTEQLDVFGSLLSGDLTSWRHPWSPGVPGARCERTRLQAAYNALFRRVVSTIDIDIRPSSMGDCPFSNGMDEWSALRYSNQITPLFQRSHMKPHKAITGEAPPFKGCATKVPVKKATAPATRRETISVERVKRLYSVYHEEILSTYSTAPCTYYSDACGSTLPVSLVATCLTAATLAATSTELSKLNRPSFSIFSSIARFRTTVCAHTIPCLSWRTGHWDVKRPKRSMGNASYVATSTINLFESIFMATVGPSNQNSIQDIRRLRERRTTLFPWTNISMSHPRYRALRVRDAELEFSFSRGVFTARTGEVGGVEQALDLPPNVFFTRVLKASRSMEKMHQRFPSLIIIDGDSLYRGLFYTAIQRLREHGLGSTTTYPLDANLHEVLPPVLNSGGHGESVYFMYPTPTGMVDVLVDRHGLQGQKKPEGIANFCEQRHRCAEALSKLVNSVKDTTVVQRWIIKFLSSSMIGLPDNLEGGATTGNATYAPRAFLGVEKGTDVILYAHIICGTPNKGIAFHPSCNCPLVVMFHTFNKLQQVPRTDTWSLSSLRTRQKAFKSVKSMDVDVNPLPLVDVVDVGMRIHGAGAWHNEFPDSVLNAAALSSEHSSKQPITINRLATSHVRRSRRESCAIIQMKEGLCSANKTSSPGSDITGVCSLVSPTRPGSHVSASWDAYPKEHIRYSGNLNYKDTIMIEKNLVFEGYARAIMAIWESSLDSTPNNTIFSSWCHSTQGQLQRINSANKHRGNEVLTGLAALCGNPYGFVEAVKSSVSNTNTVFYDAALLRSLSPFKAGDTLHYDCNIETVHLDNRKRNLRMPGMFTFPNNTLRALTTLSESLCITPTLDAAGLAHLLTSSYPSHFTTEMNITALYDSVPAASEGSLTVGIPTSYTDDHCRATFQRSELSLLFGARFTTP